MKHIRIFSLALLALVFTGCISTKYEKVVMPANAVLLDVRDEKAFEKEHIAGAKLLPHDQVAARIEGIVPDKSTPIFVYCRTGKRAGIAIEAMKKLGYKDIVSLGGIKEAKKRLK